MKIFKLEKLRENEDLKKKDIANKLNISNSIYSRWENNKSNIPTERLIQIANLFKVNIDYILDLTNSKIEIISNNEINKKIIGQRIKKIKNKIFRLFSKKNNTYYNDNKKVNLLNGAIITSGPEFFIKLGMKFKDSGRVYQDGDKKGQPILIPDIKSIDDIPNKVKQFFDDSYKFLEDFVGKENIIYASVHLDEDTPHMHFYFLPVVDKVKRKVFETDSNGVIIKQEIIDKKGNKKLVPIQKKDKNGKNIYKTENGKFLNCDQFWKDKGGKLSFARVQDSYNEYINNKGYNLYRGNKGANVEYITTQQKKLNDLQKQVEEMQKEFDKNKELNELELRVNKDISNINNDNLYNPTKKKLGGYKEKDVNKLIDYSKDIQKDNIIKKKNIIEKDLIIKDLSTKVEELTIENTKLKNGVGIKERDDLIQKQINTINNQKVLIKEKNNIIESLENKVRKLSKELLDFKDKIYSFCDKLCKALGHLMGIHYTRDEDISYDDMEYYADKVIRKHEYNDKSDDFGLGR